MTPRFVAGYEVEGGIVVRAAPILRRHLVGKTQAEAAAWCRSKGWTIQLL